MSRCGKIAESASQYGDDVANKALELKYEWAGLQTPSEPLLKVEHWGSSFSSRSFRPANSDPRSLRGELKLLNHFNLLITSSKMPTNA